MTNEKPKYDLESRLIQFALLIIDIVEMLPNTRVGNHIAGQLLRSGTSPSFNYGEAQVAESRDDFIHKMKICLKELKETNIALQIIRKKPLINEFVKIDKAIAECKELISIFVKSIETAKKNKSSEGTKSFYV
ncbi:MAG: four helix bundle protein [Bacteroidetes bacterium RIFCSPLOWO2_02_FULL_36_8]|nr:MAG: four helix bundle protein [Bacteroidetes bacterium RIFCSPLOWO2_02_FULL_36_8]OFY69757.1 MAG: four helix bundle protein [Bacteroidetes bacterium RIFCSPLOWO2_12_FULL_37_12]